MLNPFIIIIPFCLNIIEQKQTTVKTIEVAQN